MWSPVECGGPAILLSPVELSGSAEEIQADLARRAGIVADDRPIAPDLQQAAQLFVELPEALAHLLSHGTLAAGRYDYANPLVHLPDLVQALPDELRALAAETTVHFDFSAQDDALLRASRWRGLWMDAKRPYGDMTYFELDMADILGQPTDRREDGQLPADQVKQLWKLHTEMLSALQVFLQRAAISPGAYPDTA